MEAEDLMIHLKSVLDRVLPEGTNDYSDKVKSESAKEFPDEIKDENSKELFYGKPGQC